MKFKSILFLLVILIASYIYPQVEAPSQIFNRGKLWESVYNGKIGPSFNNWRRTGVGLDWPGYDPSWITENIGGAPSYLLSGGMIIGCKKTNDSILTVEDWSIGGGTVSSESGAKYKIIKHSHLYKDGQNYGTIFDPKSGEEVIQSVWEYNLEYTDNFGIERQLPIRVKRTSHNWSGSKRDENYIIHEYVIKNISPEIKQRLSALGDAKRLKTVSDTLKDFYSMLNYAIHSNSRSWSVNFPTENPGAKNTLFIYDAKNNLIYGKASDYKNTESITELDFGYSSIQGRIQGNSKIGEYLAPGFVGISLLYATPNKSGIATKINKYGWCIGDDAFDFSGPLTNKDTRESQYALIKDPSTVKNFVISPGDPSMGKSRMWSMMSLGPWDIFPGDSIIIAIAEIVDGADYSFALNGAETVPPTVIQNQGKKQFDSTLANAKFTYTQKLAGYGFNHPDPPRAPQFKVNFWEEREKFVANQITWGNETESLPDPDDGQYDLKGYRLYRSDFLPIGPWQSVGTIYKGDPNYYNPDEQQYVFVDSSVQIGVKYYYALTAFDEGRSTWNVNSTAVFPETNSNRVPSLESSIFANRMTKPFLSTFPPTNSLDDVIVVPNPFVLGEGYSQLAETDQIQFVNIPNPCTIRIYTIRGDLVKTIEVADGSGAITSWNQLTDYGLYVESGIYIFYVESKLGNKTGKFAIVR